MKHVFVVAVPNDSTFAGHKRLQRNVISFDQGFKVIHFSTLMSSQSSTWRMTTSCTDDIIILLHFIFTGLHGYEITPGLRTEGTAFCC